MDPGLIFPVIGVLARPDTSSIDYDDDFREGRRLSPLDALDPIGPPSRVELPEIEIELQVLGELHEMMRDAIAGDSPDSFFDCTAGRRDLSRRGLINADGLPLIPKQTRLVRLLTRRTRRLIIRVDDPPGLYLQEIRPRSFGLSLTDSTNNLWFLRFTARELSVR